jgi:hypothetical protein
MKKTVLLLFECVQFGVMVFSSGAAPVIHRYQNKVLKFVVNAPWYIRNSDHRDLGIETVTDIIAKFANSNEKRLKTTLASKHPDFST